MWRRHGCDHAIPVIDAGIQWRTIMGSCGTWAQAITHSGPVEPNAGGRGEQALGKDGRHCIGTGGKSPMQAATTDHELPLADCDVRTG